MGSRADNRPRILVTGFGPFPGVPDNPTGGLVRSLPSHLLGLKVHRWVLPVSWQRGPEHLARAVDRVVPHLVLMLGVGRANALELQAYNRMDGRPDVDDELRLPGPIMPTRATDHALRCGWPVPELVGQMRGRGHELVVSRDAGRYLCNACFYRSFELPATAGSGFLHVAPGPYQGLSDPRRLLLTDLIRALDLWLRT